MFTGQSWLHCGASSGLSPEQRVQLIQRAHEMRAEALKALWAQFSAWLGRAWYNFVHQDPRPRHYGRL